MQVIQIAAESVPLPKENYAEGFTETPLPDRGGNHQTSEAAALDSLFMVESDQTLARTYTEYETDLFSAPPEVSSHRYDFATVKLQSLHCCIGNLCALSDTRRQKRTVLLSVQYLL